MTKRWKKEFADYASRFGQLSKLMIVSRKYLKAKYDALLPEIDRIKKKNISFSTCQSCGYDSSQEEIIKQSLDSGCMLVDTECLVCELQSRELRVPCIEDCEGIISILELGEGECDTCQTTIAMQYLLDNYADPANLDSEIYGTGHAYCDYCEYTDERSVALFGEKWLCFSCLKIHDQVGLCDYCNEFVAGNLEDSFLNGCLFCDGQMGHYMESDD